MTLRRRHAFALGAVATAIVIALALLLEPSHRIGREPKLRAADRLSEPARAALRTQMHAHGAGMLELTTEVTLLDYDGAAATAQRILDEPRVARPVGNDATELNAQLPARFFALQDELRLRLQAIANTARTRDAESTAEAMGQTMRTCVRCHDAYLTGK